MACILAAIIIFIILAVIFLLPFGVDGGYSGGEAQLSVKIGPFRLKLIPKKEKPEKAKKPKKPKKEKKKKNKEETGKKKKKKKLDIGLILQIIKLGIRALGRFRRRLNIDYVRIKYTVATGDPFDTAMQFAAVNAAICGLCPQADRAFNIKKREIGVYSDFLRDSPVIDVWLTITINLLDLLYVALAFGIEFLVMFIKRKREQRGKERKESNGQASSRRHQRNNSQQDQGNGGRKYNSGESNNNA